MLSEFIEKHQLGEAFKQNALKRFIPLAEEIVKHQDSAKQTYFVAVNGCQGSGKSTLSAFLQDYIEQTHQLSVAVLSLDDFYLSKSERRALSVKIHPLFQTRGVPGTHDTSLLASVLDDLASPGSLSIPRFDKASDEPFPEHEWPRISAPVDIVIFEGWCWGVRHQHESALAIPCNALETNEDALGVWRHFVNQKLATAYEPLYQKMDFWLMLKAPNFENVYQWRLEQETKLAKSVGEQGKAIMDADQIHQFIQYFQRLTEHSLDTLAVECDRVFELNEKRDIVNDYSKGH